MAAHAVSVNLTLHLLLKNWAADIDVYSTDLGGKWGVLENLIRVYFDSHTLTASWVFLVNFHPRWAAVVFIRTHSFSAKFQK